MQATRLQLRLGIAATMWLTACMQAQTPHTFTVSGKDFLYDGKPYQIISGEMHYTRIPREYWHDRFQKARAMGLNTITTYAFWNVHEPHPGTYDFTGQNDIAEYIREAQAAGLNVILRPGPYVCAEWELGGYPSWLLKDRSLQLRSTDPNYTAAVNRWFERLAQEVKPLLLKNGGPILAVQVENEYGSFGSDRDYLEGVRQQLIRSGMGDSLLYTANPPDDLTKGSLPDLPAVINFGTGDAEKSFAKLESLRPAGPRMTGEFWAGWFDKWGEPHHETDGKKEAAEFRWMLEHGYSVSLYMFHGGTSFGWMNGADSHTGKDYHPDTTSYDYNAPLDESGNPTYKYTLFREAIAAVTHSTLAPMPETPSRQSFPVDSKLTSASLWQNLPTPQHFTQPPTFEDLGQNFGYVLYRTQLKNGSGGKLVLDGMHDFATVFVDRKLVGTADRRLDQTSLDLPVQSSPATLDILVENTGRVNYSKAILTERTGLTGAVTLAGKPVEDWDVFSLPMDDPGMFHFTSETCNGPCFFKALTTVARPADTYLDTRQLHKGQLWLNGRNLGRFWTIGPQFTLYVPGPWLHVGSNNIVFFDLFSDGTEHLSTRKDPVFGEIKSTREKQ